MSKPGMALDPTPIVGAWSGDMSAIDRRGPAAPAIVSYSRSSDHG